MPLVHFVLKRSQTPAGGLEGAVACRALITQAIVSLQLLRLNGARCAVKYCDNRVTLAINAYRLVPPAVIAGEGKQGGWINTGCGVFHRGKGRGEVAIRTLHGIGNGFIQAIVKRGGVKHFRNDRIRRSGRLGKGGHVRAGYQDGVGIAIVLRAGDVVQWIGDGNGPPGSVIGGEGDGGIVGNGLYGTVSGVINRAA